MATLLTLFGVRACIRVCLVGGYVNFGKKKTKSKSKHTKSYKRQFKYSPQTHTHAHTVMWTAKKGARIKLAVWNNKWKRKRFAVSLPCSDQYKHIIYIHTAHTYRLKGAFPFSVRFQSNQAPMTSTGIIFSGIAFSYMCIGTLGRHLPDISSLCSSSRCSCMSSSRS